MKIYNFEHVTENDDMIVNVANMYDDVKVFQ